MDYRDIEDEIYDFNTIFFDEIGDMVESELDFIEANNLITPKENYTILVNFLHDALRQLRIIDPDFCSNTLLKLDQDTTLLQKIYKSTKHNTSNPKEIFELKFLSRSKILLSLTEQLIQLKNTTHTSPENRDLSRALSADIIELKKIYYNMFIDIFHEDKEYFLKALLDIINTKTYYFDKLMWKEARKSMIITKHFHGLKIEGDMNSKKYIFYTTNLMRPYTQEYQYLESCLRIYK